MSVTRLLITAMCSDDIDTEEEAAEAEAEAEAATDVETTVASNVVVPI